MTRGVALLPLVALLLGCSPPRLDESLCPRDKPPERTTVLLLDTSDPLSEKHREELSRLVRELRQKPKQPNEPGEAGPGGSASPLDALYVAPGEELVAYTLRQELAKAEPVVRVCNPGDHPNSWAWQRELTEGKQLALAAWRRFEERVAPLFAAVDSTAEARSPILEFLGVIIPRHASSERVGTDTRTHLIIFSDLLQHSDALSHYGTYPQADAIVRTAGLRHLRTDLTGVDVSLYRLERSRDGRWQTTDHYYWWTKLVKAFGGKVIYQQSV